MIKSAGIKVGANKKQYLDILLGDKTGEINAKKWDVSETEAAELATYKEGDLIKVKAQVTDWQGQTQLRITRIRKSNEADNLEIEDYIKAAPEKSEEMFDYIYGVAESMEDEDLKKLCTKVLNDNKDRLMYYPAASKNHHAEYGGLLYD